MKQYLVIHKDFTPEEMQGGKPRDLNGVYLVHSDTGGFTADLEMPLDEDGQPVYTLEQTVAVVAGAMYANTPSIMLRQSEALTLLSTPHWRVYAGQYTKIDDLLMDCATLGFVPSGSTLEEKISSAKAQLQLALGG